jgi:hypothetical protein
MTIQLCRTNVENQTAETCPVKSSLNLSEFAVVPFGLWLGKVRFVPPISWPSIHWNINLLNAIFLVTRVYLVSRFLRNMIGKFKLPIKLAFTSSIERIRKCVLVVVDCVIEEERGTGSKCRDASNCTAVPAGAHVATIVGISFKCGVWKWRSIYGRDCGQYAGKN